MGVEDVAEGSTDIQLPAIYSVYGSLRSDKKDSLSSSEEGLIKRLDSFEAPYLEEKLLSENKLSSSQEYQEAFTEFKKYTALTQIASGKMSMPSEKIDEVWHQFILFTPQYHDFCQNVLGTGYLHHQPKTSYTPLSKGGTDNFVKNYQDFFGEIPEIWNVSGKGSCDDGDISSGFCGDDPCGDD